MNYCMLNCLLYEPMNAIRMRSITCFILCFISRSIFSQVQVVEQMKFEHEGAVITSITPNNKVIAYSIISEKGEDDQLELVAYNEQLQEEGRFQTKCAEKNIFRTHALSGSGEYYFSLMIDKNRQIHSVVFNTSTFEGTELRVELEKKFEPNGNLNFLGGVSTACFKNKFFILGTVRKVPCILVYNMLTGTQHLTFIPGMGKKERVSFLSSNEAAPSLQIMFFNYKSKKIDAQYIASLNEFGEVDSPPMLIKAEKGMLLIDGNVTWLDEHTSLICGATGESSSIAKGMYILEVKDGMVVQRSDYDFNGFKDFYSTFNAKTQRKIEKKKKRNKNFESQCYMVTHPVVFNENAWTIVGEVFYPTYRTELRTTYVNGRPVTQTVYVFDGYAYSHAVVLQVSPELEKIKDYTFELSIVDKPYHVRKFIRIAQVGTKLNFYYASHNTFGHASLENGGIELYDLVKIVNKEEDLKDSEKIKSVVSSNVEYWYDNFYLTTETFVVKDREEAAGKRRKDYVQFKKVKIDDL